MAEYIDREKIFPNGVFYVSAENPESSLNELINRICNLPTADVVPKSEVDKLKIEIEALKIANGKMYEANKAQAREIFEEIEEAISAMEYNAKSQTKNATIPIYGMTDVVNWVLHEVVPNRISELKKKYI